MSETDLMDVDHTTRLRWTYRDYDGSDWRFQPHDDAAVASAMEPDAPSTARGKDSR
jgi:hypothetical protein